MLGAKRTAVSLEKERKRVILGIACLHRQTLQLNLSAFIPQLHEEENKMSAQGPLKYLFTIRQYVHLSVNAMNIWNKTRKEAR